MAGRESSLEAGTNRLLAALPRRERDRLLPQLEPVVLSFEEILYEPEAPIRHVYFPTSGLISLLLVMDDASVAEVGRGRQRGHGRSADLPGGADQPHQGVRAGSRRGPAHEGEVFQKEARMGGPLSSLLLRYTQTLLRHSERLTACNNRHTIEQRLCRWLLVTHDRVQADQFEITQEFLAQMLGVHRQSVTLAASRLQRGGLIRYSRGKLTILDRRGLETASCECYRAVKKAFETLYA